MSAAADVAATAVTGTGLYSLAAPGVGVSVQRQVPSMSAQLAPGTALPQAETVPTTAPAGSSKLAVPPELVREIEDLAEVMT